MVNSSFLSSFAKLLIMRTKSMQIKFEGQEHQIDANTLINVLLHYQAIIAESNKELGGGSKNIELKVNALGKGSFIIDISLMESLIKQVFSSDSMGYLSDLCAVVGGTYAAYKILKGKPAKTEEEKNAISIKGDNNTVIINSTIIKVYNQPLIREAISKSIETADADTNVEGLSLDCESVAPVIFKKKDFKELIYTDFDLEKEMPNENEEIVDATLVITKLSFEKGATWQFLYNGFKISLVVKDDALMNHIDNGARFAKGDAIKVKMKIVKRYNSEYNAYENKGYKILEFIEHIVAQKPNQGKLF